MPEEINRRAIDAIASLHWAPDQASAARLLAEGHPPRRVRAVGNAMVDTPAAAAARGPRAGRCRPGCTPAATASSPCTAPPMSTTRRRSPALLAGLAAAARVLPLAWPLHPRTAARLAAAGLALPPGMRRLPPLAYLDFLGLLARARLVATDSGGVQEEATALDLPCLTLRPSTERPVTLEAGSNRLVTAGRPAGGGRRRAGRRLAARPADPALGRPGRRPHGRPSRRIPGAAGMTAPLVLLLSAAHPPDDIRVVRKEGAALAAAGWRVRHLAPGPPAVPAVAGVAIETYPRPRRLARPPARHPVASPAAPPPAAPR